MTLQMRKRRMRWLGHILRLGENKLIRKAVVELGVTRVVILLLFAPFIIHSAFGVKVQASLPLEVRRSTTAVYKRRRVPIFISLFSRTFLSLPARSCAMPFRLLLSWSCDPSAAKNYYQGIWTRNSSLDPRLHILPWVSDPAIRIVTSQSVCDFCFAFFLRVRVMTSPACHT